MVNILTEAVGLINYGNQGQEEYLSDVDLESLLFTTRILHWLHDRIDMTPSIMHDLGYHALATDQSSPISMCTTNGSAVTGAPTDFSAGLGSSKTSAMCLAGSYTTPADVLAPAVGSNAIRGDSNCMAESRASAMSCLKAIQRPASHRGGA